MSIRTTLGRLNQHQEVEERLRRLAERYEERTGHETHLDLYACAPVNGRYAHGGIVDDTKGAVWVMFGGRDMQQVLGNVISAQRMLDRLS